MEGENLDLSPIRKVLSSLAHVAVPSGAAVHWMTLVFGGGGAWG